MARKSRYKESTSLEFKSPIIYRAGIYRRISDEEDKKEESLENQQKIILDFLKDYSDIQVIEVYTDNGFTGMNYQRPGFQKMFKDILSGKINCVIVKDVSRLGRHYILTSEFIEQIFPKLKIRLICVNDAFDTLKPSLDSESLLMPFRIITNDMYAKDTSKKIKSAIRAKITSEEFLPASGSIPYGYIRNAEKCAFDVDCETAVVVLRIYEMRAKGMKYNAIAALLNKEGIPSPLKIRCLRGMTKNPKGEKALWSHKTIRAITNDSVYIGNRIHGKLGRNSLNEKKVKKSKEEWIVIEHAHPSIVSKELFTIVQEVNLKELDRFNSFKKCPDAEFDCREILRGKIFCGDCMNMMKGLKGVQRDKSHLPARIFFECSNYHRPGHLECCSHYIRQDDIVKALKDFLSKQIEIAVDIEKMILEIQGSPQMLKKHEKIKSELQSIGTRRRNMQLKIEKLLSDFIEGDISKEEYKCLKEKYTQINELIIKEENKIKYKESELNHNLNLAKKWTLEIKRCGSIAEIDKEIIDALIRQILIYKNKKIMIYSNFADPYEQVYSLLSEFSEEDNDVQVS